MSIYFICKTNKCKYLFIKKGVFFIFIWGPQAIILITYSVEQTLKVTPMFKLAASLSYKRRKLAMERQFFVGKETIAVG